MTHQARRTKFEIVRWAVATLVVALVAALMMTVTAAAPAAAQNGIAVTSPSQGAKLSCGDQTFIWAAGTPVAAAEFWLYAGSTVGGNEYYDSLSLGGATTDTIAGPAGGPNLPDNGSTVYVRLWYKPTVTSSWTFVDSSYEACGVAQGVAVTSPIPGTALLSCGATALNWVGSAGEYWVYAGSALGGNDYYDSGNIGAALTTMMTGLPVDASTIYVRLWHRSGGAGGWSIVDETFTACVGGVDANVTSPTDGTALLATCDNVPLTWEGVVGSEPDQYWVYAGSSAGAADYMNSGDLLGALTTTLTGLPSDSSTIHVTLWYRETAGTWESKAYTYTACDSAPLMIDNISPTDTTTLLVCGDTNLSWTGNADEYWVYVSTAAPGANEIQNTGNLGGATSVTMMGLPEVAPGDPAVTIYVRIFYRATGGAWQSEDVTYTACTGNTPPMITAVSPAPPATLGCGQVTPVTYSWTGNADEYWVQVFSIPPNTVYFDSGSLGTDTMVDLTGLPTDGTTVSIRLWYRTTGGTWLFVDNTYTSCTPVLVNSNITAPLNGSALSGSSTTVTFDTSADQYFFTVGSSVEASDLYTGPIVDALFDGVNMVGETATVFNLPADGSQAYITLWYRADGGPWLTEDVVVTSNP